MMFSSRMFCRAALLTAASALLAGCGGDSPAATPAQLQAQRALYEKKTREEMQQRGLSTAPGKAPG